MSRHAVVLLTAAFLVLLPPRTRGDEPEPLKPLNLSLNTNKDEDDPHLSSDGLRLYYSVTVNGRSHVHLTRRTAKDRPWLAGKPLPDLEDKGDCRSVFLTADGRYPQHLYVGTNFDPEKKDGRGGNFDIYFLIKQSARADYTTPTPLHFCTPMNELHPWLLPDGRTLYFSRKDKDAWHVYVVTKPVVGQFGKPVRVNLPDDFFHPTLTPDGRTMYLQGRVDRDKDRWGLFRSIRTGNTWSKPEPLAGLDHPDAATGDRSPGLSRDGSMLYFTSDRPGGQGGRDIWVIPVAQLNKKK